MGSSNKFNEDPNLADFTLNPNAKSFTPYDKNAKYFEISNSNVSSVGDEDAANNISLAGSINITTDLENVSAELSLNNLRSQNINRVIIAHININSIRNKFELLSALVMQKIDVLLVSESKINKSFPDSQFEMAGFLAPYKLDRDKHGGGLLLYVREDIPSKQLPCQTFGKFEYLSIEINIYKNKWLIF